MRNKPITEGCRWLMQAKADRKGALVLLDAECYHLAGYVYPSPSRSIIAVSCFSIQLPDLIGQ